MSKQKLKTISGKLKKASQAHASQAKQIDGVISAMPMKKSSALKKISAACKAAAKRKFKSLSASGLASWMIKSRKGNLSRIISSLNQQVVFRRGKDPKYAAKMRRTMEIVRKRLGKKKK